MMQSPGEKDHFLYRAVVAKYRNRKEKFIECKSSQLKKLRLVNSKLESVFLSQKPMVGSETSLRTALPFATTTKVPTLPSSNTSKFFFPLLLFYSNNIRSPKQQLKQQHRNHFFKDLDKQKPRFMNNRLSRQHSSRFASWLLLSAPRKVTQGHTETGWLINADYGEIN